MVENGGQHVKDKRVDGEIAAIHLIANSSSEVMPSISNTEIYISSLISRSTSKIRAFVEFQNLGFSGSSFGGRRRNESKNVISMEMKERRERQGFSTVNIPNNSLSPLPLLNSQKKKYHVTFFPVCLG